MVNEWMHCNFCGRLPGGIRYHLSNCGHISCQKCLESVSPKCKKCNRDTKVVEIKENMDAEVKQYFEDPFASLKEFVKEMEKIGEFQSKNRARLQSHLRKQILENTRTTCDNF